MAYVTIDEYVRAIEAGMKVAQRDTGQSSVMASVLLAAYNGNDFNLDITDLCRLDDKLYQDALTIIRGRVELRREPYALVEDGDRRFRALRAQWPGLLVEERAKFRCPTCDGHGVIYPRGDDDYDYDDLPKCTHCGGSGRVCRCKC